MFQKRGSPNENVNAGGAEKLLERSLEVAYVNCIYNVRQISSACKPLIQAVTKLAGLPVPSPRLQFCSKLSRRKLLVNKPLSAER